MTTLDPKAAWPGWTTVKLIGRGSFGAVYEIERELVEESEKAALKVISIPQDDNDVEELRTSGLDEESITAHFNDYLKDIIREYSLMTKIKGHTNVVYCDDLRYVQKDDGIGWDIFIKMELLTPLTKALGKACSEEEVIKAGRDIANALVLCKKRNIVHRDIKPQNIFVSDDGAYKLGDFGIARTMEKTSAGTRGIGTLSYMAPEVYNNQPYGHTADIYSLGLVLYWLLNDQRMPFLPLPPSIVNASDTEKARVRRFSGEPIPAPAHGCEELKRIVLKACVFEPKERYQSAAEMLEDLEELGLGKAAKRTIQETEDVTEPPEEESDRVTYIQEEESQKTDAPKADPGIKDDDVTVGLWKIKPKDEKEKPEIVKEEKAKEEKEEEGKSVPDNKEKRQDEQEAIHLQIYGDMNPIEIEEKKNEDDQTESRKRNYSRIVLGVLLGLAILAIAILATFVANIHIPDKKNNGKTTQENNGETTQEYSNVFWTDDGTVYHLYVQCPLLDNAEKLHSGSVEEAISNGKTRLCKRCEGKADNKEYEYNGAQLILGGADSSGTMYQVAVTIADTFSGSIKGMTVVANTSSGSNENALQIHEGTMALGLCSGTSALEAVNGTGRFADKGSYTENIYPSRNL